MTPRHHGLTERERKCVSWAEAMLQRAPKKAPKWLSSFSGLHPDDQMEYLREAFAGKGTLEDRVEYVEFRHAIEAAQERSEPRCLIM